MAYYTVAHLLQGGVLDGSQVGPLGVDAKDLCDKCWDYVFLGKEFHADCKVSQEKLDKMKHEFNYWYPMDLRVSGKDLIRNHLTMSLYNHAAMWNDHKMMPKAMFCNGYMVLNNEKMSKSTGNFLTIKDCIKQFGVDATRITLADAGDHLDDANFDTEVANASILKLFVFEQWIQENMKASFPEGSSDFAAAKESRGVWDTIFENAINNAIEQATTNFEQMKYKQALKSAFFELQSVKEDYLIASDMKANPYTLVRYLHVQLTLMNPIVPHFAQFCWENYVYPIIAKSQNYEFEVSENLNHCKWPEPTAAFDATIAARLSYMKDLKGAIKVGFEKAKTGGKKKPKKGEEVEAK